MEYVIGFVAGLIVGTFVGTTLWLTIQAHHKSEPDDHDPKRQFGYW